MKARLPVLSCLLSFALLGVASSASAEEVKTRPWDPRADAARAAYFRDRDALMGTLGFWSGSSLVLGGVMVGQHQTAVQAAGVQNLAWGVVDGVIAGLVLTQGSADRKAHRPEAYWLNERRKLQKLFVISTVLDIAYVVAGAALLGAGQKPVMQGTGAGMMLQGGFMFVFGGVGGMAMARP